MTSGDLTTVDAVKNGIQLPSGNVDLDALLPDFITQASKIIMDYTRREFAPVSTGLTRRFAVNGYKVDFSPWDLQSATAVSLHPETTEPIILSSGAGFSNAQYMLKPVNPSRGVYQSLQFSGYLVIVSQTLMQFGFALLDVTGTWGFPSVPEDVERACILTVGSWVTRTMPGASTPYGIPPGSAQGAIMHGNNWDLPWAAKNILGRYRRGSSRWATL